MGEIHDNTPYTKVINGSVLQKARFSSELQVNFIKLRPYVKRQKPAIKAFLSELLSI